MRGRRRPAAILAAGLVILPLLAGCGQAASRQLGVTRTTDGRFALLVGLCGEEKLSTVAVYNEGTVPSPPPGYTASPGYDAWRIVATDGAAPISTIDMFVTPTGWHADSSGLTSLVPDEEYGALVGTTSGASGAVKFTLADLGTLRPDTVWTRLGGYLDGVVSMADFRQRSDADCAS